MFGKKKKRVAKFIARGLDNLNERLDEKKIDPDCIITILPLGKNFEVYYVEDAK